MIDGNLETTKTETAPTTTPKPWYLKSWAISLWIFLGLLTSMLIAFSLAVRDEVKKQTELKANSIIYYLKKVEDSKGEAVNQSMGNKDAKITLVEFGDFSCVYSKNEYPVLREFIAKHSNELNFIWRDAPVLGQTSIDLAMAGRCAGEQNLFWLMHDYLYQNQGISSKEDILLAAQNVGADARQFAVCMENKTYLNLITNDLRAAQRVKIGGTPALYMNDYALPAGEVPLDILEKAFNELKTTQRYE